MPCWIKLGKNLMKKLSTELVLKSMTFKTARTKKSFLKGKNFQIQHVIAKRKGGPGDRNVRLLKAVYDHFAKKKVSLNPQVAELQMAMEEAKSAYQSICLVQKQLNRAYLEFINRK